MNMPDKDDTTWHVWYNLDKRYVDKYPNRDIAYREHKAASKEGLRSYLTQHDPTNDKD